MPLELDLSDLDFAQYIMPGETVIWTQGAGEPLSLLERLIEQRQRIGTFRAFVGASYSNLLRPEFADVISFIGLGGVGSNRSLTKARAMDIIPCYLDDLPELFAQKAIPTEVVLVQLSSENEDGDFTLSTTNGYIQSAIDNARIVIAEINDQAPKTKSRVRFDTKKIDILVRVSRPLVTNEVRGFTETDRVIAANIARWIPDGAVLQLGIGGLPNALATALSGHQDLGLHSGTLGDCIVDLIESGVVNNSSKHVDLGKTVTGTLVGSKRLYDFVGDNDDILVEPVTYTHDENILSGFDSFFAVNSAVEVDLTGQINAEVLGNDYVGTIGGQVSFVRGAIASKHGRSIIALPSLAGKGRATRIVPKINSSVVTTLRAEADIIVTEHGCAELRGIPIRERIRRMINIADPSVREMLEQQAKSLIAGNF